MHRPSLQELILLKSLNFAMKEAKDLLMATQFHHMIKIKLQVSSILIWTMVFVLWKYPPLSELSMIPCPLSPQPTFLNHNH
ncbi:hypothetical protein DC496_11080 [Bifidobacterium breve]|uniref:Uncharacterized protein n=1 Tax=Bifidobacterium breve TaxID=1685 RepID=A0AAW7LNH2_BIFBR|nr:hypothetical protein [Bifidobacterium breve]